MIEPNSTIKLIKNCPLDCDYTHTILFTHPSKQKEYFYSTLSGFNFVKHSYQRYADGVIVVAKPIDELYECNYLMFQNTNYSAKWFYAFIKDMEYVNENGTKIYYELDVMQSYLFEVEPRTCFVEREHSKTDNIGDNLVGENLYFGEYVYGDWEQPVDNTDVDNPLYMWQTSTVLVFNTSFLSTVLNKWSGLSAYHYESSLYSGVYQGVSFFVIPTYLGGEIVDMVNDIISSVDFLSFGGYVCGFMIPQMFVPNTHGIPELTNINRRYLFRLGRPTNLDGYTPRNKKLFTYPYVCGELTNKRGSVTEVKYEYSDIPGVLHFYCEGNFGMCPSVIAYPKSYKGVSSYYEGGVSIGGYPNITWGADGITEWVNNNLLKTAVTIPLTSMGGKYNAMMGYIPHSQAQRDAIQGGITGAINAGGALVSDGGVHGNLDSDVMIGSAEGNYIEARQKMVTKQYAQIIDSYFDRFGYATNITKVPNRDSRPHWNYVKTVGFTFDTSAGGVPCNSAKKIASIYDTGITFWKNANEVGDYTLDNRV